MDKTQFSSQIQPRFFVKQIMEKKLFSLRIGFGKLSWVFSVKCINVVVSKQRQMSKGFSQMPAKEIKYIFNFFDSTTNLGVWFAKRASG
jgi:hypothetical protein